MTLKHIHIVIIYEVIPAQSMPVPFCISAYTIYANKAKIEIDGKQIDGYILGR